MIVIDPGHGGDDPGAVGNGIIEKDYNFLTSQYMFNRFNELGVPVMLTRNSDETLPPTERIARVLNAYGNDPSVLVISNHINAGGGDGAEVIYALRNDDDYSKLILEEISKEGQNIRKWYQRRLPSDPELDYYFMHRNTGDTESVIVEYGFLDSPLDDVEQIKSDYENFAEATVRATMRYLGLPYTPPEGIIGENIYTVKKGDSLYSIAREYDTSVEAIKQANNLTSNLLSIGQVLIIPSKEVEPEPGEYAIYTVKSGDSLYKIANATETTVDNLIEINNLSTTLLSIGQELLVPKIDDVIEPPPTPGETEITYVVKSGDSLYSIARRFGITVQDIIDYNNLISSMLSIDQILKIPVESDLFTYTVKSGDSLYAIAREYNITADEIKKLNNLTSNLLSIGQQLLIPLN